MLRKFLVISFAAGAVALGASAGGPLDVSNGGNHHESIGQGDTDPLQRGVVYQASTFALALRVRPPDGRWEGVQYQSGRFRFMQLQHLRTGNVPLHGTGWITLEAARGSTGTVAQTVQRLHSTPKLDAGPVKAVRVAGFSGRSFDAAIVGTDRAPPYPPGISLAPFTKNRHCGFCTKTMHGETLDHKFAGTGQLFRILVFDVRGKTVVAYLESGFAEQPKFPPARTFPTFLPYAQKLLSALSFPA